MYLRKISGIRGWTICTLLAVVAVMLWGGRVFGQTWNGSGTDWNTASDWSPATVPNSAAAIVNFDGAGAGVVDISSSVSALSLTFDSTMGPYNLTSDANQTLTLSSGITVGTQSTSGDVIDLSNVAGGSLLFTSGSNLALTNNSIMGGILVIDPSTVIGSDGNGSVIFGGPGATSFLGSFSGDVATSVVGGLTKSGSGTFDYAGSGDNLSGGLTLNGGVMQLDYSNSADTKLAVGAGAAGALTLDGGILVLIANGSTPFTQSIPGGTVVNAGQTDVKGGGAGGSTIALAAGAITRSAGATADFSPLSSAPAFSISTSTGNTNQLLGSGPAFATASGGTTWATEAGGVVAGLTTYGTNVFSPGTNTDLTTSTPISGFTTNSLRFNAPNSEMLTLSGTNTLQSGGILVTPTSGSDTITGGTLTATGSGELIIQQYSNALFTVNSALVSATGLTKAGTGVLQLGGNNTGLTGPINVNRGGLTVTATASVNSSSAINFNDDRTGILQQFTVNLGANINGTIGPSIRVSAFNTTSSDTAYGTYFSSAASNSRITLNGVLSSAPGQVTPILFTGSADNTAGFNLTNSNTFTGNINLLHGFLGIGSDANLGNPANVLSLDTSGTTSGGLIFLGSGANIAHSISVISATRIVSNTPNTISGLISGSSPVYKDGTGTLTLTNSNNSFNGDTLAAGSLVVGADADLGASTGPLVFNGGTLETTASFALASSRAITINVIGTFVTDPLTTLTISQGIGGTGTFFKLGTGTLMLSGNNNSTASFNINTGTLALGGGTLAGGPDLNNGQITGYGTIGGSGGFTNNGFLTPSANPIVISNSGTNTNFGTISLTPIASLGLGGSGLTNSGTILLASAAISGTATLTNAAGGSINGPGIISAPFSNNAGGILANGGPGSLSVTFAFGNAGLIQLASFSASLNGGPISNTGMIQGVGSVGNAINNTAGTIEAVGGTLVLTGADTNSGVGIIRVSTGTEVLMQGSTTFPSNAGLITLAGGTFDNGGNTLDNIGQITGYGVLATGGLTNDGAMTFSGGTATVNGTLTNDPGDTVTVQGSSAVFTNLVSNSGTFRVINGGIATFAGGYSGGAISNAAINAGNFTVTSALVATGNFTNSGTATIGGAQSWLAGATFTNTGGSATFASDTGSMSVSPLSINIIGGSVNFGSTQHLASLTIASGATATASASSPRNVIVTGLLSVAGSLDLTNNDMIVHNGNLSEIESEVAQGRGSDGLWASAGITSSFAAATPANTALAVELNESGNGGALFSTFDGQPVINTDVLVKYTFVGDANLDGVVNAADYQLIDNGFNLGLSGWRNGDFNYDGVVDGDDFTLIDNAFNTQGSVNFSSTSAGAAEMIAADTDQIAAVPEPGTLGLLAVGVVGLLAPRRWNRRMVLRGR